MVSERTVAKPSRVQSRLLRVFVLQLALISVITVTGIFAASLVAERILVNQALVGEASYFWNQRAEDPEFPLPNTLNLQSWFAESSGKPEIPEALAVLPTGQHRVMIDGDDRIVYVSQRDGDNLYLLFQDETVSNLAFYFGVVPLAFVLLVMYSLAFLAYWLSKRAVSPIASMVENIERFDFNARDASELDLAQLPGPNDTETQVLAHALEHFVERSKASIERERNFTRYASHELRTPIAVIQGSIASLELVEHEGAAARAVARIKRTSGHMAQLINSLLLLARDRNADDTVEPVDVVQLIEQLIDEMQTLQPREHVQIVVQTGLPYKSNLANASSSQPFDATTPTQAPETESGNATTSLVVDAPVAVLSIVLGNILRNAWKYTDRGRITVTIHDDRISIEDTGDGLTQQQQARIFEPFYRVNKKREQFPASGVMPTANFPGQSQPLQSGEQIEGLGLGLAIVRHFCDVYSWQLTLTSELQKGSCFELQFSPKQEEPIETLGVADQSGAATR